MPRLTLPIAAGLLLLAGCDDSRPAPPAATASVAPAADGLPVALGNLPLDGSVITPTAEAPVGPGMVGRALADKTMDAMWGPQIPWGEQVAQRINFPEAGGFRLVTAWIAAQDRRKSLGIKDQTFTAITVSGLLRTPEPGIGQGQVWGVTSEGALRGLGTSHQLIAWEDGRFVVRYRLRGTRDDLLAVLGDAATPWRAFITRLRRAVDKGADLRQMRGDLAILRNVPPDCRADADALLATRTGQIATAVAALPTGSVLARAARLIEACRLHSDADQLGATALIAKVSAWRSTLAADATAQSAAPGSAALAGWRVLAWRALLLSPSLPATDNELSARVATRDFLARVLASPAVARSLPVAQALPGIVDGLSLARPVGATTGPIQFSGLAATVRDEDLFHHYTVPNPRHAEWRTAMAEAEAAVRSRQSELSSAQSTQSAYANYETKVTKTVMVLNVGNTVTTEFVVNPEMKRDYDRAGVAVEQAKAQLQQAAAQAEGLRAAEPPQRTAQSGRYRVQWQEWRGNALAPAGLALPDGSQRDLSVTLAIQEGDRRTAGFSAPDMLANEGLPAQDGWRSQAQVEAALGDKLKLQVEATIAAGLLAETRAAATSGDAEERAWAAWLLGGGDTAGRPTELLPTP